MSPSPHPAPDPKFAPAEQIRYWLEEERRLLLEAIHGLTEEDTRETHEDGSWSVHDALAHRMFWESEEAEGVGQYLLGKRIELLDFPLKRIDGTNVTAVETLRKHSTERLLREIAKTRAALLELVCKIPDDDLNQEDNPARTLLGVAIEHDREHRQAIQDWRRQRARTALEGSSERPGETRRTGPP